MDGTVNLSLSAFFSGTFNRKLAESTVTILDQKLANCHLGRFSDGEIEVKVNENVRGKDVYIFQSTPPPAENLIEVALLADALRRASAASISAVIPYLGYSRQDRRPQSSRSPISARVIADILAGCGLNRILTVELHSEQIQGFFSMPVENLYATTIMLADIQKLARPPSMPLCLVSPDIGGVIRARAYAKKLGCDLAIIDKRRNEPNSSEVMNIIGEVEQKYCIIVDDIVDTAGTLCNAADALKQKGAVQVAAYCTHALLSGSAIERIQHSGLDQLVVTDTLPLSPQAQNCDKIRQLTLAQLLANAIQRIKKSESLSALFV
ncbi:MAG: ribose-phosphate pyrophosphokinase [Gammaproteobacteria bacterium]